MNSKKRLVSDVIAWFGLVHGSAVVACFLSGFVFSSIEAYEVIWVLGQILTFGFVEPEFIPYPEPSWLSLWALCLIFNRFLVGTVRFLPWKA